jgi:uncharacterized membrane protein YiaA
LLALYLNVIVIGPEVAIALGRVLADKNNRLQLQTLYLNRCRINNAVLANLVLSMGGMRHE